jgi:hypothetical protein
MSGGDGMDPSTQVPAVKCAWVPVTASYRAMHLMSFFPRTHFQWLFSVLKSPRSWQPGTRVTRGIYS